MSIVAMWRRVWASRADRRASKPRKSIRKRYWLNLELLENRFAPVYGVLSLGAPTATLAPGQRFIVPVNFTDTDASGNSLNSSATLQAMEIAISFDSTQVQVVPGVFSGPYAVDDGPDNPMNGSVSLGKITSEPGTNSQDGYAWAFTNSFLDNYDNSPTGSNPGVLDVIAARLGTYGLPGGAAILDPAACSWLLSRCCLAPAREIPRSICGPMSLARTSPVGPPSR